MLELIIDNIPASDYELCLVERPPIPTPKRKIIKHEVEGRDDGALTELGEYEDINLSVELNILLDEESLKTKLRFIKVWLLEAKTLSFNDEDVFYKVKYVEIDDIENEIEEYGKFEVGFTLGPHAYFTYSSLEITGPEIVYNPGTYKSNPFLKIYGSGEIKMTINDKTFLLKDVNQYVIVDSQMMECYKDTSPQNHKMIGDFPFFQRGANNISWTGNVSKVEIEGRWRYL
ncbi:MULTISPECIES: phage tail domain-containing protein [Bacillus]|uniref:phage tail domain-containing protein n=1 Tax=Bacillus cereus group TaxID=86661 RepID=UPI0006DB6981|nr:MULTISPECIES: phage tail domain-containing protein [Bacillus cereus group]KPU55746.1 phage tail family protein [Bacillus wiedmannii]MBE3643158.1 phage tail family protein [Bacillus anthracis]MDI6679502.1 phage tail family protein [Bacillus wiedmannii]PHC80423.1 phage tail protein [Bacillus wiedmannii]PTC12266.1 phage tail protein [Bacillus wiedmannii]